MRETIMRLITPNSLKVPFLLLKNKEYYEKRYLDTYKALLNSKL